MAANPRKFFVGGNWKMNGDKNTINTIIKFLNETGDNSNVDVVVAPPAPYLIYVKENLKSNVKVAAQNCYKVNRFYEPLNIKFRLQKEPSPEK